MSFSKVTGYLLFPSYIDLSIKDDPRVTPAIASIFNEVANRRLSNLGNRNLALERYLTKTSRKIRLLNIVGVISFFILAVYYFMRRKHPPSLKKYIFAVTFIFLLILSRLILYTLIDVFFFPARLRYVFPGMPLLAGVSVANIFTVLKLLSRRW